MRKAYLDTLYELADKDKNVYAVISDNGAILYDKYREVFPDQFINAGISEANMVGMAAGMAERGKIPFAYTIGAFLAYRAYEFILNDVCMMNKNVKLVGIGAGCSYSLLGASHHTIFDIAALRPLPNLTIFSPASPIEVAKCVKAAYEIQGPVYIRLGTSRENEIYNDENYTFIAGKAIKLRCGTDATIISTGSILSDVICATNELEKQGIDVGILNIHTIKPIDKASILQVCKESKAVLVVEEHSLYGGLGSAVSEIIAENNCSIKFSQMGFSNFVQGYGTHAELKKNNGLGIEDIVENVIRLMKS